MRPGARLGVDVGQARIGLASSDPQARVVLPLETVNAHPRSRAVRLVAAAARDRNAVEVVVGLPKNMDGSEGKSARAARTFAAELAARLDGVRVCLVDERLTTTQAQGMLRQVGLDARSSRGVVDQMAAHIILEQAIASEMSSGTPAGEEVRS